MEGKEGDWCQREEGQGVRVMKENGKKGERKECKTGSIEREEEAENENGDRERETEKAT